MRWLADECISSSLVAQLREDGHDVIYVAELTPGSTDTEVLACAQMKIVCF